MDSTTPFTFDQLVELRPKTNEVANFLRSLLTQHLETLRPLLDPARVLGKPGGSGRIAWIDKNLGEFRALYDKFARPFRFPPDNDLEMFEDEGARIDVQPWEYGYEARNERETTRITMSSPTRWSLSYASDLTPERMKRMVAGREQTQLAQQHRFVLLALLLKLVVQKSPRVVQLMKVLRFDFEIEPSEELYGLPLVTVRFALPSFRPDDSLLIKAANLSGIPAFIELVDMEAVRAMTDPLKAELEKIIG